MWSVEIFLILSTLFSILSGDGLSSNENFCKEYFKYLPNSRSNTSQSYFYKFDEDDGSCVVAYCSKSTLIKDYFSENCNRINFTTNYDDIDFKDHNKTYINFCKNGRNDDITGKITGKRSCLVINGTFTKFFDLNDINGDMFMNVLNTFSGNRNPLKRRDYYRLGKNYTTTIISYILNFKSKYENCLYSRIQELHVNDFSMELYDNEIKHTKLNVSKQPAIQCVDDVAYEFTRFIKKATYDQIYYSILGKKILKIQPELFFEIKLHDKDVSKVLESYLQILQEEMERNLNYEDSNLSSAILSLERIIYLDTHNELKYYHKGNTLLSYMVDEKFQRILKTNISCESSHNVKIVMDYSYYAAIACIHKYDDPRNELIMVESPYDTIKYFSVTWEVTKVPNFLEEYTCNFLSSVTEEWSDIHCEVNTKKIDNILKITCKCPLSGYVTTSIRPSYDLLRHVILGTFHSVIALLFVIMIQYNFKTPVYRSKYQNRHAQIKLGILIFYFISRIVKLSTNGSIEFCYIISTFKFVLFLAYNIINMINALFYMKLNIFTGMEKEILPLTLTAILPVTMTVVLMLYTNDFFLPLKGCFGNKLMYHAIFVSFSSLTFIIYQISFIRVRRCKIRRLICIIQTLFVIIKELYGLLYNIYESIYFIYLEIIFTIFFGFVVFGTELYATRKEQSYSIDIDDFRNLRGYD